MSDYTRYVDGIRAMLQSGQLVEEAVLYELSEGYAKACAEANERLTACTRLLGQGLRGEAIHQAEIEPNLLSMLTTLDFPERPDWDALVDANELFRAQPLNLDAAAALNEAYAAHDPLRDLLRRHRRMALARAPLTKRLELLRAIAAQDPDTPLWREDVKEYEQARLTRIPAELGHAVVADDVAALQNLVAELEDPRWSTTLPHNLVRKAHKDLTQVRRSGARRALDAVARDLAAAFDARDLAAARGHRDRWAEHASAASLADDDGLLQDARPALQWVEDEDRREAAEAAYTRACETLRKALDRDDLDYHKVNRIAAAVRACGRGVPRELTPRLAARLKALSRRWWRRTLTASVAAAVFVVAGLAGLWYATNERSQSLREARAALEIDRLVGQKKLDDARTRYKGLDPQIQRRRKVAAALTRLEDQEGREKTRIVRLAASLKRLNERDANVPDPPELKDAEALARSPEEKERVGTAKAEYGERFARAQDRTVLNFRKQVSEVEDALKALKDVPVESDEFDRAADAVESLLRPYEKLASTMPDEARRRAKGLRDDLAAQRNGRRQYRHRVDLESRLTRACTPSADDPKNYADALKAYTDDFKTTPRGRALQTVREEQGVWGGALAWAGMADRWVRAGPVLAVTPREAAGRITTCVDFLKKYPAAPEAELAGQYLEYLRSVARREGLEPLKNGRVVKVRDELLKEWNDDFAARLRVFTYKNKKHYYTQDPRDRGAGVREFFYYVDFDKTSSLTVGVFDPVVPEPAPQCAVAEMIRKGLQGKAAWDGVLLTALGELQWPSKAVDFEPVYRVDLIKKTAKSALEGSDLLEKAGLATWLESVDRARIDTAVKWMTPDPTNAADAAAVKKERDKAVTLLKDLPTLADVKRTLADLQRGLEQRLGRRRLLVGWLAKDGSDWQVRTPPDGVAEGTELWVACPPTTGPPRSAWQVVGKAGKGGRIDVTGGTAVCVEGRPVFAEKRTRVAAR